MLQSLTFNTTDKEWQKCFIDRTLPKNEKEPLFKLLKLKNFAIYYKTNESVLLQRLTGAD
jgi:hypothetical protein